MPSKPVLTRAMQRKIEFQDRIVNAAVELFAEQGVDETPIKAIVSRAGIAHKTFFNHFPTKSHLIFHIANLYTDYSNVIFMDSLKLDCSAKEKLSNAFTEVANGLLGLHPSHLNMFKHLLQGVTLGPESSKVRQLNNISKRVSLILHEARDKEELREGLSLDHYIDNISQLFISTLLVWSNDPSVSLLPRMKRTIEFIEHSTFK